MTGCQVSAVVFEHDGVSCAEYAAHMISAMGAANTVACLDAQVAEYRKAGYGNAQTAEAIYPNIGREHIL